MNRHPMQPIVVDEMGVHRFKRNALVCFLLDFAKERGLTLNDLACLPFEDEDREQLAQLMGYSVCGFCDLSYVGEEVKDVAMARGQKLLARRD